MAEAGHITPHKPPQILVVDDDAGVRGMLVRVMIEEGYGAWPAASGAEAIKVATTMPIDLALLDLGLPGMGGWDIFDNLTRRNPLLAVIVMTARSGQVSVARASGVGAFFEKPLDFPTLLKTIRSLLAESPQFRLERLLGEPARQHELKTVKAADKNKTL